MAETQKKAGGVTSTRPPAKHSVKVSEDSKDKEFVRRYGGKWVASFSCKWTSERSTRERAEADAARHKASV